MPNTLIFKECLSLVKKIEVNIFQNLVLSQLIKRKVRCPELLKSGQTPFELKQICYTLDYNQSEYLKLYEFLNKKLHDLHNFIISLGCTLPYKKSMFCIGVSSESAIF